MTVAPLAIVQARLHSTRLSNKMLLTLQGETLIARAWNQAVSMFGEDYTIIAIPASDDAGQLGDELRRIGARVFAWDGDERDVLGRFYECAHAYRWHPDSIIVRWTADDYRKDWASVMRVIAGERLPVEQGGEAFTLAMLDAAHAREPMHWQPANGMYSVFGQVTDPPFNTNREHITYALFPVAPPRPPDDGLPWSIDTQADYDAAVARVGA